MKKSLLVFAFAVLAVSCTSERKDPPAGTQTKFEPVEDNSANVSAAIREDERLPKERVTYTLQGEPGCRPQLRVAMSRDQLCTNLQYPEQNGSCGLVDRMRKFSELCGASASWNQNPPALETLSDFSARCEIGYTDTTDAQIEAGINFKIAQTIYDNRMELRHSKVVTRILLNEEADGQKTLSAKMIVDGVETGAQRMTWRRGGDLPTFMMYGPNKEYLSCVPHFREESAVVTPAPAPAPEPTPEPAPTI